MAEECVFCKVVNKELPTNLVYEDEKVIAILDLRPVNRGHTLVITKKHRENIHEINEEEISYIYKIVKKIADAQKKAFSPAGISVAQNNGRVAGQIIFHFHIHVIPKNLEYHGRKEATGEDLNKTKEELKRALGAS